MQGIHIDVIIISKYVIYKLLYSQGETESSRKSVRGGDIRNVSGDACEEFVAWRLKSQRPGLTTSLRDDWKLEIIL